ncbi:MAG: hypothetical protein KDI71_06170 [Xanthomonadales bacterium]|nr:hypothetical protein [Xanthomonadales bacterium]
MNELMSVIERCGVDADLSLDDAALERAIDGLDVISSKSELCNSARVLALLGARKPISMFLFPAKDPDPDGDGDSGEGGEEQESEEPKSPSGVRKAA